MTYNLLCSQGRVGDKTINTLQGAKLTAQALEKYFDIKYTTVGYPSPAKDDKWTECLPEASVTLELMQDQLRKSLSKKETVILASNTCSVSLATLPVVVEKYPDIKILWIDAHGDFNTPKTSETGYLGGMVLSAVCGLWDSGYGAGLKPSQVTLVGAHDIDDKERIIIKEAGIQIIPPRNVTAENVLEAIGDSKIWIHIDWDVLEPGQIPADYKVKGGLYLSQLIDVFKAIPCEHVLGLELAEFSADVSDLDINKSGISNVLATVNALLGNK